jgi:hypothetical protein
VAATRERHVLDGVHAGAHAAQHARADVEPGHEVRDLEHRALGDGGRGRHVAHDLRLTRDGIDDRELLGVGTALHRAQPRDCGKQRAGVGLARRCEQPRRGRLLHRISVQHDDRPVGDLRDDAHVVRDEHHRHALFILQRLDQLDDLGLDGDVQRGGRLVGDEERRLAGERHGDHHALAHAAGQPVRIFVQARSRRRDAHALEDAQGFGLRLRATQGAVVDERLADLEAEGEHRVEARHRLLEDHRDAVAADLAHLSFTQGQEVAAFQLDMTAHAAVGGGQQPHDRQRRHAFTRARFADDGDRLARRDVE